MNILDGTPLLDIKPSFG
ncbi:MAG: hypothetical protein ACE14T_07310 [Syntrophales bacterium]